MRFLFAVLALSVLVGLMGCGGSSGSHFIVQPPPPGPVSMEVVLFPGQQDGDDSAAIQKYLMNNTQVALGATIVLQWSAVDNGSGTYDWSYPDGQIAPWASVGKKVNLDVWPNSDGSSSVCGPPGEFGLDGVGNCAIPAYVWTALTPANFVICTPSNANGPQQMPNYFNPTFQQDYKNFIAALLQHYGSNPNIGYIRIGLGRGGETIPVADWDDSTICGQTFARWGYSVSSWDSNYIGPMLQYEGSLHSSKRLMVGFTSMGKDSGSQNADFAARIAAPLGIGIGSEGLQANDLTGSCSSDWCNLFATYPNVPHELQTVGQSCPNRGCPTGSLATILPFAVANRVTILELYYQDWLTGFDPNYPGYTAAYATAIENASAGKQ